MRDRGQVDSMANWHTYSRFIKTAAGMLITVAGVTTIGIYIRGQHLAELTGGYVERSRIAYISNNDTPSTNAVYIGPNVRMSGLLYPMDGGRNLATNPVTTIDGVEMLTWSAETLSNGFNLVGCESEWTNTAPYVIGFCILSNYTMNADSITNIIDYADTTASIVEDDNTVLLPQTFSPNLPYSQNIYGDYSVNTNQTFFGGTNNWWTVLGINAQIPYKYGCEKWRGVYENVTMTTVSGGFFSFNPQNVYVSADNGSRSITIESESGTANELRAELFTLQSEFEDRQTADFVVSDMGGTGSLVLTDKTKSIDEDASPSTLGVKLLADPITPKIVSIFSSGSGFTIDKSSMTFTTANFATYQHITITPLVSAVTYDQCGLVVLTDSPLTHVVAIQINNTVGVNNDVVPTPSMLQISKSTGGTLGVSLGTNTVDDVHFATSKYIRTNNLVEAHTVLDNLTTTVAVINGGELTGSGYQYYIGGSTSAFQFASEGRYVIGELVDGLSYLLTVTNSTTAISASPQIFQIQSSGVIKQTVVDGSGTLNTSEFGGAVNQRASVITNASLPYPSAWAITNGYVTGYDVYASFVCQHAAPNYGGKTRAINAGVSGYLYTNLISYTADNVAYDYYETYLYGIADCVRHHPELIMGADTIKNNSNNTNTYNTLFMVYEHYYADAVGYTDMPLTHIAYVSCTNLTTVPTFTLSGDPTGVVSIVLSEYQTHSINYVTGSGIEVDREIIKFDTALAVQYFIVVTHYDFVHCNTVTPFVPTAYTPDWMTSNTNSP